jgi:DNA-binding transcriptional ArsR family regulator
MADLLPSSRDTSAADEPNPRVVGLDSEDADDLLAALSSETARDILNAVYDDPGTASELAERLDMSIQKVSYHLEKLENEELIAVAGTQYSEKGQEMNVYEPPEDPLVLFVGTQERKRSLRSLAKRLLPVVGILTAASAVVQFLFGTLPGLFTASSEQGANGGAPADATTESPTAPETPTPAEETATDGGVSIMEETATPVQTEEPTAVEYAAESTETAAQAAASGGLDLEPGVAFFLGGLLVVAVVTVTWYYTE